MPAFTPAFIDHLVYRISDLDQTARFYLSLLGAPAFRNEQTLMYVVGQTRIFFTTIVEGEAAHHDKEKVGLNHLAFGTRTLVELQSVATQLNGAGIANSGIKIDPHGQKEYIWLDDPDGLRIEFYLRAKP